MAKRIRRLHERSLWKRDALRRTTSEMYALVESNRAQLGLTAGNVRVYSAMLSVAVQAGALAVTASNRQLAEIACVGSVGANATHANTRTVSTALGKLAQLKLVERTSNGTGREASGYQLADLEEVRSLVPNDVHGLDTNNPTPWGCPWTSGTNTVHVSTAVGATHPVWSRGGGLGPSAEAIYRHVRASRGVAVQDLAAALGGLGRNAVSRQLAKLEEYQLVQRTRQGRADIWTVGTRSLDDVADDLGVLDRPERQRRAHQAQRANYAYGRQRRAVQARHAALAVTVDPETGEIVGGTPHSAA